MLPPGHSHFQLKEDEVRVAWPDGMVSVHRWADVRVVARQFMLSDPVVMAAKPDGQIGMVIDLDTTADIELLGAEEYASIQDLNEFD